MRYKMHTLRGQDIPDRLRSIPSPPKVLFVAGNVQLLTKYPGLAIVGSRKASAYGKGVTDQFTSVIAGQSISIISGLALGIDACAHRSALAVNSKTIAVLPTGLDNIYPRSHHQLADDIITSGGALVSEHSPETTAYKPHFVTRNRLISGLSDGVLVTEAARGSGSLHTANYANKQGKPVWVVPGPITSPSSAGCHQLIQEGAHLATKPTDILQSLQRSTVKPQTIKTPADKTQALVLRHIKQGISSIPALQHKTKLSTTELNQALTMLEIESYISIDQQSVTLRHLQ